MRVRIGRIVQFASVVMIMAAASLIAQRSPAPPVTAQDLLDGLKDPSRWLTFSGDYSGRRNSPLTQITPANVSRLSAQWTFQTDVPGKFEASPLVLDGIIYVTGVDNNAWAIDARSGRQIWRYRRDVPEDVLPCCGRVNRGFGMLGDKLFMVTLDAHLLALDMKTGTVVWDAVLEDFQKGYAATIAPLVVGNNVIVGVAGGEFGIRGFIDAYNAQTGKRTWRFYTVPAPDEPGGETWPGDSWQRGGGSVWKVGSYDPELDTIYYGTGNPSTNLLHCSSWSTEWFSSTIKFSVAAAQCTEASAAIGDIAICSAIATPCSWARSPIFFVSKMPPEEAKSGWATAMARFSNNGRKSSLR